ncbi:hypothetical protein SAMN05216436_103220 [bacterium A37T11]|nr:hypothetical protein SAMN05216436_103220 [bacterium A37T11]
MKTILFLTILAISTMLYSACGEGKSATATTGQRTSIPDSVKVPYEVALQMVANYAPRAGYVDRGEQTLPDSRAVWFSIERLNALLAQLNAEKADGIRFYFSTYNDTYKPGEKGAHVPPPDYWGYNTLLMVSTKDSLVKGVSLHRDYFTDTQTAGKQSRGFVVTAEAENFGGLCPPPPCCYNQGALLLKHAKK